jgi:hypothetical protein
MSSKSVPMFARMIVIIGCITAISAGAVAIESHHREGQNTSTSKPVVEKATSGLKDTLKTQV